MQSREGQCKMSGITAFICKVLADQLGVAAADLGSDQHLDADLGATPLDILLIITDLEVGLGIKIPDSEMHGVATVGDLIEKVRTMASCSRQ
jgi:acyl carrier protein